MSVQSINPPQLVTPEGYVHVTVAPAGRLVNVAGQIAADAEGRIVADDLAGQTAGALRNVATALAAAGAELSDVVSATLLVVGFTQERLAELMDGAMRAAAAGDVIVTAATLVPVPALAVGDALIEIAVTAIIA